MIRMPVASVVYAAKWLTGGLVCFTTTVACQPKPRPAVATSRPTTQATAARSDPQPPASAPATQAANVFEDKTTGFKLSYPSGWARQDDPNVVLKVTRKTDAMSVDVPDLPPHIPGLIPLRLVENGFVDDLRKAHPDLKVESQADATVGGTHARRVHSNWTDSGKNETEIAVLAVHGDHVYIFRADGSTESLSSLRSAFDDFIASVQWTQKK